METQEFDLLKERQRQDALDIQLETASAVKIQAVWRGKRDRERVNYLRDQRFEEAVRRIQQQWRQYVNRRDNYAARRIQSAWYAYSQRQVFAYYRDLIRFREKGDPAVMLRCINPRESELFDAAAGVRVRFRLGGDRFPPVILYKVFTHRALVDVCSFSPRDYVELANQRRLERKMALEHNHNPQMGELHDFFQTKRTEHQLQEGKRSTWYKRVEQNPWREVSLRTLKEPVEPQQKPADFFHPSRLVRERDLKEARRRKKIEWLKKLYTSGVAQESIMPVDPDVHKDPVQDPAFETEADQLLQWTETLDFDAYHADWLSVASSDASSTRTMFMEVSKDKERLVPSEASMVDY